jgi:hypothetical protein
LVFTAAWSDTEAKAESRALFPEDPLQDVATLCPDCYAGFLKWFSELDDETRASLAKDSVVEQATSGAANLDRLGEFYGLKRKSGELDAALRLRIMEKMAEGPNPPAGVLLP